MNQGGFSFPSIPNYKTRAIAHAILCAIQAALGCGSFAWRTTVGVIAAIVGLAFGALGIYGAYRKSRTALLVFAIIQMVCVGIYALFVRAALHLWSMCSNDEMLCVDNWRDLLTVAIVIYGFLLLLAVVLVISSFRVRALIPKVVLAAAGNQQVPAVGNGIPNGNAYAGQPNPYGNPGGNPYGDPHGNNAYAGNPNPYGNPGGNPYGDPHGNNAYAGNHNPYGNPGGNPYGDPHGNNAYAGNPNPYGNPGGNPYGDPHGNNAYGGNPHGNAGADETQTEYDAKTGSSRPNNQV